MFSARKLSGSDAYLSFDTEEDVAELTGLDLAEVNYWLHEDGYVVSPDYVVWWQGEDEPRIDAAGNLLP